MYKRLNIAICDDDKNDARILADMIKNRGLLCDIDFYSSAEGLLAEPELPKYDLFFLDIYLGGMTGVELAREIRSGNNDCELVFTTTSDAHALEGFEVSALHYLVKPIDPQNVDAMFERFIRIRDRRDLNYLTVIVDRTDVNIYYRDIYYIEAFDKYCKIYTANGNIETYSTLAGLLEKLPNPPFLRCHRSYVVNMSHINNADHDFIMKNGDAVYIRRPERARIKKEYMKYLVDNARGEMREKASY